MKRWLYAAVFLMVSVGITGCTVLKIPEQKKQDIKYEIVERERIPKEMNEWIEKHKEKPFQIAFTDQGYWYIAQGYGKKEQTGYEIEMDRCYETGHTIMVHTLLYGPEDGREIEEVSYPFLVVRTKWKDKMVVFMNK